jgi:hypothetical protein
VTTDRTRGSCTRTRERGALFYGAAVTLFDGSGKRESARDHVTGCVLADAIGGDEIGERCGERGVPDPAEFSDRGGGQRRGSCGELRLDPLATVGLAGVATGAALATGSAMPRSSLTSATASPLTASCQPPDSALTSS